MAHTLIRIVEEIENEMGEMDTPQKCNVFSKLISNFVVLAFQGSTETQNEYGQSVAQAFMEWAGGDWEVRPGDDEETFEWRYTPPDGKGEAPSSPAGGEQN